MAYIDEKILLSNLPVGKSGIVLDLLNKGAKKRRFLDLGLTPNTLVKVERLSPSGNPIAFNVRGAVIALRKDEASKIVVNLINRR